MSQRPGAADQAEAAADPPPARPSSCLQLELRLVRLTPLALAASLLLSPPSVLAQPTAGVRAMPSNQRDVAQTAYDSAARLRRRGIHDSAVKNFERIPKAFPSTKLAVRALASAGAIRFWELGDKKGAVRTLDAALTRAIGSKVPVLGGEVALRHRLAIAREASPSAELSLARQLYRRRPESAYAPELLWRSAKILVDDLDQPKPALAALSRLVNSFPKATRVDDARYLAGALLRRLGRPEEALRAYRKIIATHTDSLLVADYNSKRLDDAYLAVGTVLEEDLRRPDDAEQAYLRLLDELPESRLADDALFFAARVAQERGEVERAAAHRARLRAQYPDSKYLRRSPR